MEVKFIADEMCGRLARWLRLLGFDTLYVTGKDNTTLIEVDDDYILSKAIIEGRILITRDVRLYRRALSIGTDAILIRSNDIEGKLREVLSKVSKNRHIIVKPRCPICNSSLRRMDKRELNELSRYVPPNVLENFDEFLFCDRCKKVYWFGSHWKYIKEIVKKIGFSLSIKKREPQ